MRLPAPNTSVDDEVLIEDTLQPCGCIKTTPLAEPSQLELPTPQFLRVRNGKEQYDLRYFLAFLRQFAQSRILSSRCRGTCCSERQ
jgi:hypothetical protein